MSYYSAPKILSDILNTIYPDVPVNVGTSVRLRSKAVMSKVKKIHATPYILAHISRNLCYSIQESVAIVPVMALVRNRLYHPVNIPCDATGLCSFDALQRQGMESLKQALQKTIADTKNNNYLPYEVPLSRIKHVSVASVVNKRRRQEDRWFFEPDLVSYAPLQDNQREQMLRFGNPNYPRIVGCGVFDGHGGPEAAEHCSNLAPFLLSRRLQQRFIEPSPLRRSSEMLPDILTSVIHELNFSVEECHRNRMWSSGTTGTISLIYGDHIYTIWIGDSQGVLFSTTKCNHSRKSLSKLIEPTETTTRMTESAAAVQSSPKFDYHKSTSQPPPPLDLQSIDSLVRDDSDAVGALVSPTSPRTRAARWGLSLTWLTSLIRSNSSTTSSGGGSSSKRTGNSSGTQLTFKPNPRAPLATQEVEEELTEDVIISATRAPYRYGSLPAKKSVAMEETQRCSPTRTTSKRVSGHFSEPSLAAAVKNCCSPEAVALSAGHRISPAGDLRGSRSTSVAEKSLSMPTPNFKVLTLQLHRPEYAAEFVSVLRAGGCVTFKPAVEIENEDSFGEGSRTVRTPAPVMSNAQLFYVPDLSVGGTYRVGGIAGVTRSLGANGSMIPGLSSLPSLSVNRLHSQSTCLILASDGLWDTYGCSPDDLTHFFRGTPNRDFAKLLTDRAVRNGSSDNVTVLVVWLSGGEEDCSITPMEYDLQSPCAYPMGTRCASVPCLGDARLRGPLGHVFSEGESTLPRYVEPQERTLSRSHSAEDLADVNGMRASSPMRVVP